MEVEVEEVFAEPTVLVLPCRFPRAESMEAPAATGKLLVGTALVLTAPPLPLLPPPLPPLPLPPPAAAVPMLSREFMAPRTEVVRAVELETDWVVTERRVLVVAVSVASSMLTPLTLPPELEDMAARVLAIPLATA